MENLIDIFITKLVDEFVETIYKNRVIDADYFTCNTDNIKKYMYPFVNKLIPSIMEIPCENINVDEYDKKDQKIIDNLNDIATEISFKIFKTIPEIIIDIDNDDISSYCWKIIRIIIDFKKSYDQIYSSVNQIYEKFIEKFKRFKQQGSKFIKTKYEFNTNEMKKHIHETLNKFIPIMKNIYKKKI
jgi:hypothetical protein